MSALAHSFYLWVIIAYLVGAIPMGVLLARLKGIDLASVGSGNIGATNAARALGTKLGLLVFVLDAGKAALPVWLAAQSWALHSDDALLLNSQLALIAFATVVGHVFPVYLRLRGGKGVACGLGIFIALDPAVAVGAMVMYVQGLWLTRTSAVGSLTAVTAICVCVVIADKPLPFQVLSLAAAALIWARHTSNIRTLIADAKARKQKRDASS